MDLLDSARAGFQSVDAADDLKAKALDHLRQWLTGSEFAPYRPQIEWLIRSQKWSLLLDSFYQVLPFGTGGRRGAVGIGPTIIQNKRGDDPTFLNTAWTLQVVRGFILWLGCLAVAWPGAYWTGSSSGGSGLPLRRAWNGGVSPGGGVMDRFEPGGSRSIS